MADITADLLDSYVGHSIGDICGNNYASPSDNHCAHFVNHVLQLAFHYNCKDQNGGTAAASNIRVHETFANAPDVGAWPPADLDKPWYCFITQTSAVNVDAHTMDNIPKKHVGIYLGGMIWNYSNTQHKVVSQTPDDYSHHFAGTGFTCFYGSIPDDANAQPYAGTP